MTDSSEFKIYIDPGHGGTESGASFNNILEKNINLQVASKIYSKLQELDYDVELSRTADVPLDINLRSEKAMAFFNQSPSVPRENRIFVSVHHNAPSSIIACNVPIGLNQTWVLHRNDNQTSQNFSNALINSLKAQNLADSYRVCSEQECSNFDTLGVLRETADSPNGTDNVALIEYNFICFTNTITSSIWQEKAAQATVDGILDYIGANSSEWHNNIIATQFTPASGNACPNGVCVALPDRDAKGKSIEVCSNTGCVTTVVGDVGPWCREDSDYVFGSNLPFATLNENENMSSRINK